MSAVDRTDDNLIFTTDALFEVAIESWLKWIWNP